MNIDMLLFWTSMFFLAIGAGTSDVNTTNVGFAIGMVFMVIGLFLIFFSLKEFRNYNRLRRLIWQFKGYLKR